MPEHFHPGKAQRVLLVEKSAYIREALQEAIRSHGVELHCVETGEEGIQSMGRQRFGAVVCNYHLPGINGLDFFWKTKELLSNTVTILTASSGDDYLANTAREAGVDFFMEMPFKVEDLLVYLMGRRPYLKRSIHEFGFLSNIQNYSIASRLRLQPAGSTGIGHSSKNCMQRVTRVSNKFGGTLKVFHNSDNICGRNTARPNLKLIKNPNPRMISYE